MNEQEQYVDFEEVDENQPGEAGKSGVVKSG